VKLEIRARTGVALYPFIHIGPLTLGSYGLMVATGLICAFFILRADFARRGVSADAEAIIGITGLAGLAGELAQTAYARALDAICAKINADGEFVGVSQQTPPGDFDFYNSIEIGTAPFATGMCLMALLEATVDLSLREEIRELGAAIRRRKLEIKR